MIVTDIYHGSFEVVRRLDGVPQLTVLAIFGEEIPVSFRARKLPTLWNDLRRQDIRTRTWKSQRKNQFR